MANPVLMKDYVMQFVGLPYIWAGDDPILGFDCSGFIQEFLHAFGAHPRPGTDLNAQGLYNEFTKVGQYAIKDVGSLVFYGKSPQLISHVALMIAPGFIFEFAGGDSSTIDFQRAAEQNAFGRIRPLDYRRDYVSCIKPNYP